MRPGLCGFPSVGLGGAEDWDAMVTSFHRIHKRNHSAGTEKINIYRKSERENCAKICVLITRDEVSQTQNSKVGFAHPEDYIIIFFLLG